MKEILKELIKKHDYYKVLEILQEANKEVRFETKNERELKYQKKREAYKNLKQKKELRGEEFKKILKVGDIVKMEGTKDGTGYREVLELKDSHVVCRKLRWNWENGMMVRESYITEHYYNKVNKIFNEKVQIKK